MTNLEMVVKQELAQETNGIWLGENSNRGWYTCEITNKKMRGDVAREQLQAQEEAQKKYEQSQQQSKAPKKEVTHIGEEIIHDIAEGSSHKITDRLIAHIATHGRPMKTTTISCVDCGRDRIIKVQDAFQVKRCVECQKKHRNRRRREIRREKRLQEKMALAERKEAKSNK